MKTRTLFALLIAAAIFAIQAASKRPNIILAMADDQGWGDMGYMGHNVLKTPVFDEMAKTGLRFDRFYAAAPVCSPTRASVLLKVTPKFEVVGKYNFNCGYGVLRGPNNKQLYCAGGKTGKDGSDGNIRAVKVVEFEKLKIGTNK